MALEAYKKNKTDSVQFQEHRKHCKACTMAVLEARFPASFLYAPIDEATLASPVKTVISPVPSVVPVVSTSISAEALEETVEADEVDPMAMTRYHADGMDMMKTMADEQMSPFGLVRGLVVQLAIDMKALDSQLQSAQQVLARANTTQNRANAKDLAVRYGNAQRAFAEQLKRLRGLCLHDKVVAMRYQQNGMVGRLCVMCKLQESYLLGPGSEDVLCFKLGVPIVAAEDGIGMLDWAYVPDPHIF